MKKELYTWLSRHILFWLPSRPPQPQKTRPQNLDHDDDGWMTLTSMEWMVRDPQFDGHSIKPDLFQDSVGSTTPVSHWTDLLVETAEWLIRNGLLTESDSPIAVSGMRDRFLINSKREHPSGRKSEQFKELSNGLFVETQFDVHHVAVCCIELLNKFHQEPSQFRVRTRIVV